MLWQLAEVLFNGQKFTEAADVLGKALLTAASPETRNYVKHVMENATIYSSLLGRDQPISQRMGTVPAAF